MWDRRHFLSIYDLSREDVSKLVAKGLDLKKNHHQGNLEPQLKGKAMGMVF